MQQCKQWHKQRLKDHGAFSGAQGFVKVSIEMEAGTKYNEQHVAASYGLNKKIVFFKKQNEQNELIK